MAPTADSQAHKKPKVGADGLTQQQCYYQQYCKCQVSVVFWVLSIENEVMFPGGVSKSIFTGVAEPDVGWLGSRFLLFYSGTGLFLSIFAVIAELLSLLIPSSQLVWEWGFDLPELENVLK